MLKDNLSKISFTELMSCHLSSEPGGQSSRVRASKADPGVPVAQVEALADVLVEYSQVDKSGQKHTHLTILSRVWKLVFVTLLIHAQTNVKGER